MHTLPMASVRVLSLVLPLCMASMSLRAQETSTPVTRDQIVHVLNRVTFGPRPGDVEAVEKMGLNAYLQKQLHPETIDDTVVEQTVAQFPLLQMSPAELMRLYQAEIAAAKLAKKEKVEKDAAAPAMKPEMSGNTQLPVSTTGTPPAPEAYRTLLAIQSLEQAKLVRAVGSERQLQEVLVDFWSNHFNIDVKKGPCRVFKIVDDREVIRPHILGKFRDLLEASAKSPAMLFYLDNASNTVMREATPLEQEMTMASMKKEGLTPPADEPMMANPAKPVMKGGINENYARELMELHALGVDGGYTQKDVQEVARCFTGWTIKRQTGEFIFRPFLHDQGAKVVLGQKIPAGGGIQDGEKVLDILVAQPACAHFISRELCQRFVADDPPKELVDRVAGVFQKTGGDLRAVTQAILTSPEFQSPANAYNKIKSPLEFAVSAVRGTSSELVPQPLTPRGKSIPLLESAAIQGRAQAVDRLSKIKQQSLNWHIYELGEPLFACTPPTGYKENSSVWVSPGALIERLNFAMELTQQQVGNVLFDPRKLLDGVDLDQPSAVLDRCASILLQRSLTDATRKVLLQSALPADGESKTVNPAKLIALLLGSPEFQRK